MRDEEKMEDKKMWRWEDVKMKRCEDEKMFYSLPIIGRILRWDAFGNNLIIFENKIELFF